MCEPACERLGMCRMCEGVPGRCVPFVPRDRRFETQSGIYPGFTAYGFKANGVSIAEMQASLRVNDESM